VDANLGDDLTSLLAAITAATEDHDLPTVLQRIVEAGCTLVDARYGALGVIGDDGDLDQFVHTGFTPEQVQKLGAFPRGGGVLGVLLTDPQPVRLADLSKHPHAGGFPKHHPVMTSFLGAPIRARGAVFGNLYLTEKRDGSPFTAVDETRIVALSALAGAAIANTRQLEQLRERERWRDAVVELAVGLLAGGTVAEAFAHIVASAQTLFDGPGACIVTPQADVTVQALCGQVDVTRLAVAPYAKASHAQAFADDSSSVFGSTDALWIDLDDSTQPVVLGVGLTRTPTP